MRTYSELKTLKTFEERLKYLQTGGFVGQETFGWDRWYNQRFYQTNFDWKATRREVIIRDRGCDLGIESHKIPDGVTIIIHHLEPITLEDILNGTDRLLNPEFLITTILDTHNAIHYGKDISEVLPFAERFERDTCPWKPLNK